MGSFDWSGSFASFQLYRQLVVMEEEKEPALQYVQVDEE